MNVKPGSLLQPVVLPQLTPAPRSSTTNVDVCLNTGVSDTFTSIAAHERYTPRADGVAATDTRAVPLGPDLKDTKYDGGFIGGDGMVYPRNTPLREIPPTLPHGKGPGQTRIIYVNGILNTPEIQAQTMQAIADKSGIEVIGAHNSSDGFWADAKQTLEEKLGWDISSENDWSIDSLADLIFNSITSTKTRAPLHLMAHSQGAAITTSALAKVIDRLKCTGRSPEQIEQLLGKLEIETFGAAASAFPDGPQYVHYLNTKDPVASFVGSNLLPFDWGRHFGKGAVVHRFSDWGKTFDDLSLIAPHDMTLYVQHRVSFDEARANHFAEP